MTTYFLIGLMAMFGVVVATEKKDEHVSLWVFIILVVFWPTVMATIITDIWEKLNKK